MCFFGVSLGLSQYDWKMLRFGEATGLPVGLGNGDTSKLADVLMVAAVEIDSTEPSRVSLGRRSAVVDTAETLCVIVTLAHVGKDITICLSLALCGFFLAVMGGEARGRDVRGFSLVTAEMSRMSRALDRTSLVLLEAQQLSPSSGIVIAGTSAAATTISSLPPSMVRIYAHFVLCVEDEERQTAVKQTASRRAAYVSSRWRDQKGINVPIFDF